MPAATLAATDSAFAAYLSLVVSVSLRVRRDGRGSVGDALGENERNNITDSPPAVPLSAADDSASAAYLSLVVFVSASLRVRREANH